MVNILWLRAHVPYHLPLYLSLSRKLREESPGLIVFKISIELDELDHLPSVNTLQFDCYSKNIRGSEKNTPLREIQKGLCVAYKTVVNPARTDAVEQNNNTPLSVQDVIEKHSTH